MTKAEWIAKTAKSMGVPKSHVARMCDALLETASDSLAAGEELHVSGFGVFSVKEKAAYTARNPKTDERLQMPATRRLTFTASKVLKEKINETR